MRCPKCGYITFDHLDTCPKCKKNIAEIPEQISGTVFKVEAPDFFKFDLSESTSESDTSFDVSVDGEDVEFDMILDGDDDERDMEFSFEEDQVSNREDSLRNDVESAFGDEEELNYRGDNNEEVSASTGGNDDTLSGAGEEDFAEFDLEPGEDENTDGKETPQLDFGELDIADLAPPAGEGDNLAGDELNFENSSGDEAMSADSFQPPPRPGSGLEDLQTDGLNMDLLAIESSSGQNLRVGVRTGTALDDFDIDLGELISEKEK